MYRQAVRRKVNEDKRFTLYINKANQKVWDLIRYAEDNDIPTSDFLIQKILHSSPYGEPTPLPEKKTFIHDLVALAKRYETEGGIDGLNIAYLLPRLFEQHEIPKQDMIYLTSFALRLYITVVNTGNLKEILNELFEVNSKRDILDDYYMGQFMQVLNSHIDHSREHLKKKEEEAFRKIEERKALKLKEIYRQKQMLAKQEWLLENPNIPYWMRDMSEEERETSNKIFRGEYLLIDDDDDDEEDEQDILIGERVTEEEADLYCEGDPERAYEE